MGRANQYSIMECRFISCGSFDAAQNMAIDEAILECHLKGLVPPTLRLYQFAPPAVSIGYAQSIDVKKIEEIRARKIDIVRRPTGGRAVLHLGDLTYSFIASSRTNTDVKGDQILLESSVLGAYRQISAGLLNGIAELGIELSIGLNQATRHQPDCFAATTIADLHYQGKKLIGSAQMRRKQGVLQHGSIILDQPQDLMAQLFGSEEAGNNAIRHANLYEIAGRPIPLAELQSALKAGFSRAFNVDFFSGVLNQEEISLSEEFRSKYSSRVFKDLSTGANIK